MRNYLLASAALLGLVAANTAQAATFATTDPSRNASAFGTTQTSPDPGKIIVHMGGFVSVSVGIVNNNSDKSSTTAAKHQPYGLATYMRLYFGMDGKLSNGMMYGAKTEMRTNQQATPGNPSANSTAATLYTRRAYMYVAGDNWGLVRMGVTDGPLSLLAGSSITTGEAYDTGHWDGDVCDFVANCLSWVFPVVGNEYDSAKITYMTPKMNGFQAGISFAPSSVSTNAGADNLASTGLSARQSVSTIGSDTTRPRNYFEVAAKYTGNLGPVALDTWAGYWGSGVVGAATPAALPAGVTKVNGLAIGYWGLSLTYQGFSVFGTVTGGNTNGQAGTTRVSLASGRSKQQQAGIVGVQYSSGPYTVGTAYYQVERQGSNGGTGNRVERGFDIGGTYNVVSGLDFFLGYTYGTIHQNGVNFVDAAGPVTANNKASTNALVGTMLVRW
ncbi:MAG: porin [Alphaproteobacteria bacterium]|nr:porin [Alphaproteobacteria bacterium]